MKKYLVFVTRNFVDGAVETYCMAEFVHISENAIGRIAECTRLLRALEWPATTGKVDVTDIQWASDDFFSYNEVFKVNLNQCVLYRFVDEDSPVAKQFEKTWSTIKKGEKNA